jgi:hypothetical protein
VFHVTAHLTAARQTAVKGDDAAAETAARAADAPVDSAAARARSARSGQGLEEASPGPSLRSDDEDGRFPPNLDLTAGHHLQVGVTA